MGRGGKQRAGESDEAGGTSEEARAGGQAGRQAGGGEDCDGFLLQTKQNSEVFTNLLRRVATGVAPGM